MRRAWRARRRRGRNGAGKRGDRDRHRIGFAARWRARRDDPDVPFSCSARVPPSPRIPVDPIEGLNLRRVRLVPRLALLVVALGVGASFIRQRRGGGRDGRASAERAKEFATAERRLAFSFHRRLLLYFVSALCAAHEGSAKASVSMSINTRPSLPTPR